MDDAEGGIAGLHSRIAHQALLRGEFPITLAWAGGFVDEVVDRRFIGFRVVFNDDADGLRIADAVKRSVFALHLAPQAVNHFGAAGDFNIIDALILQPFAHRLDIGGNRGLAIGGAHFKQTAQMCVGQRVGIAQPKVFKLLLPLPDAQTVGERRINIQRLLGDLFLLFRLHRTERAHVVQPVGQLDQHHPDVLDHAEHHFAQRFRFAFGAI